jgi:hypothetical protein
VVERDPLTRIFTYEEAAALLPEVQRLTAEAVVKLDEVSADAPPSEFQSIVGRWADTLLGMGIEVKGLWLIDFDNGSGYYCWQYPETSLQYFHGYEEGFRGRVKLN